MNGANCGNGWMKLSIGMVRHGYSVSVPVWRFVVTHIDVW